MNLRSSRFDPEHFLAVAELLFDFNESEISEASYRTIINRSYLSVLMKASVLLEDKGESPFPRTSDFYKSVEDALANRTALRSKDKLGTLRTNRGDADYDLDKPVNKDEADFAISTAKYTLALLESDTL